MSGATAPPPPHATPAAHAAAAKADAKAETKSEKAQLVDVVTPSAGESVTEAEVGEWSVKVGDPFFCKFDPQKWNRLKNDLIRIG